MDAKTALIRIPQELDVPLSPRVRNLIDTPAFRRLAGIPQLGLVSLVYPAANHTRFEHSLGVYRLALLCLRRLSFDPRFNEMVSAEDAERFVVAALLHDLGHWPFCHPIEDLQLPSVPSHELFANSFLLEGEIADVLRDDWQINPRDIVALLSEKPRDPAQCILSSMLSGPIDIDKMDYLSRDSLHAGVPYGRNFDQNRLIGSLRLNEAGDGLAIGEKGKTAAEMLVFARYVMFSEVYWHHAVRAATAMFQQAFFLLHGSLDMDALFRETEPVMIREMLKTAGQTGAEELLEGLFGPVRRLYKRLHQYSFLQDRELYRQLAQRPYPQLAACAEKLAHLASQALGCRIAPHEILFDAPPVSREVEFKVDVYFAKPDRYRRLDEVSPVVRALAHEQFDDYVKCVRIFAHPRIRDRLATHQHLPRLIREAVATLD
ncbi:MAG: HD domain-containing protein [Planctomycetales bacterium]|nr:HD domain-containing protein [Planctomycetales bacterium]NIM08383.1 HD domain-containing protein [Planctomycetales bacterium]NIN07858.1 HD domain-containing protein [Planctomycetales bacterium]NIN76989.1 HD domain-containing protein [Planctomycetales bacterium]NIO34172.1 HD domain-containing protein [Planctomycetales bacterium]